MQVTEGADRKSKETVLDTGASADVEDTELVPGSSSLNEHEEDKNFVAAEKMESKKLEHKQTEAEVVPRPVSVSPLNQSPSHSSSSNVIVKDNGVEETSAGPDVTKDTNMDTKAGRKEKAHADEKMDSDTDTKEDIVTQEEAESLSCNLRVSRADDLDEMMDIGTVDEVEQEAQMKEEEQSNLSDGDRRSSPAISNTGKIQVYHKVFVLMQRNMFNQQEIHVAKLKSH